MDVKHPSVGEPPGEPAPIPFSLNSPDYVLDGTILVIPHVGNPHMVALEVQLAGKRLGNAALTEDGALDLALRLLGTIMNRRRAAQTDTDRTRRVLPNSKGRGLSRIVPTPPSD
jgi:hypothetical protein